MANIFCTRASTTQAPEPVSSISIRRRSGFPRVVAIVVGGFLLSTVLLLAPEAALSRTGNSDTGFRHVVILNALDPYLPAYLELDRGFRDILRERGPANIELHAETLDMHRFPQTELDSDLASLLYKKYRDVNVDVVVAVTRIALDFARKYRSQIWPNAAIVFHSVPYRLLPERELESYVSGVPVRLEYETTIEMALRLRPETRRIAVVSGAADPDRVRLEFARKSLDSYSGRYEIQYIDGLSLADTIEAVRSLPEDTIVLYLMIFQDGDGTPLVPRDVLSQIASASSAPVFGVYETYLGHGIVAGSITTYYSQGARAGELVIRVLNGEDPAAIGIQSPAAPACFADWRQLQRWGMDADRLPEGCEIRFRQVTAWERYRWQILGISILLLGQAVLIAALLLHRKRLKDAQRGLLDEAERRMQAETVASNLRERLARFSKDRSLGTMATSISHELNQPLAAIQNYLQAARMRLQSIPGDTAKLAELFTKAEGQAERAGAITRRVRALVNRSEIQLLPVIPGPLVEEVVQIMAPEFESRGCLLESTLADDLPAVLAESLEVQLVLVNLLHNAMESVCRGDQYDKRICLDVRQAGQGKVQFSVVDRGGGVSPDQVDDLFESLVSGTREGMGMGLAISRAIIEAHGCHLWYEPNPEGGAIFRFTLRSVES